MHFLNGIIKIGMVTSSKLVSRTDKGPVWNKLSRQENNPTDEKVATILGDWYFLYLHIFCIYKKTNQELIGHVNDWTCTIIFICEG